MSTTDKQIDKPINNEKKPRENTFTTRIKRYGKVSGTMAGLATKLAGEKFLGIDIKRKEHAEKLVLALGTLKGPLMKIGQILATIPEALPPEYTKAFQQLQSNAPSMGWPFVRRRMKTELGSDWQNKFISFEKEAAAAASLGQVHKALAKNSQLNIIHNAKKENIQLACKLQYPDMKSAIDTDLNQLKIILGMYEHYDKTIQTKNIHAELTERLNEELDYDLEARHCKLYAHILKNESGVHVPEVIDSLSTDRLLTTTWLDGEKILNFVKAHQDQRNQLAMNMFRAWYVPLYYYGTIHGDPHLGNYTVRKDMTINLLDFGCVRVFPPEFVGGVINLYNALMNDDINLAVHAYETWGFKNLSKEQINALNIWAKFLYGPVMDDKIRPIGEITNGIYGRETAEKVHKQLHEASNTNGGIAIPREFVFMDRAALGLGSVFLHLKAEINWYKVFNELIQDFNLEILRSQQKHTLTKFNVPLQQQNSS
ncbi:MAG: AarF/ABC1/UbiB kinase family protein [Alphaproteobacteria bacterium]|nr:AarF/ABC1/UbiB kinase family protein [Alphaproteobacteria bacterium]